MEAEAAEDDDAAAATGPHRCLTERSSADVAVTAAAAALAACLSRFRCDLLFVFAAALMRMEKRRVQEDTGEGLRRRSAGLHVAQSNTENHTRHAVGELERN